MDSIDLAKSLFGSEVDTVNVNTSSSYTSPTNTTTISGEAMGDSSDGVVSCMVAGTMCDIPTTVSVKEGDAVIISNTAHNPVVTGVVAGGDRVQAEIDDAASTAETANIAAATAIDTAGEAANKATTAVVTSSQIADNVGSLQTTVDDMGNSINDVQESAEYASHVATDIARIEEETLTIGGELADVLLQLTNTMLVFIAKGNTDPVAYLGLSNNIWKLFIANAEITETLNVGGFSWIRRDNGNMSLKWVN